MYIYIHTFSSISSRNEMSSQEAKDSLVLTGHTGHRCSCILCQPLGYMYALCWYHSVYLHLSPWPSITGELMSRSLLADSLMTFLWKSWLTTASFRSIEHLLGRSCLDSDFCHLAWSLALVLFATSPLGSWWRLLWSCWSCIVLGIPGSICGALSHTLLSIQAVNRLVSLVSILLFKKDLLVWKSEYYKSNHMKSTLEK